MSLENAIAENTAAIHELIRALKASPAATPLPETAVATPAKKQATEPAASKPSSGSTKTEAESVAPSATGTSAQEFTEENPLDFKTLSKRFVKLIETKGRDAALTVLADLGLKDGEKLSDLDPTKWVEAFNRTNAALETE